MALLSTTAVLFAALLPGLCAASTISFQGTFAADNQEQIFSLLVTAPSAVGIRTFSYGGGVNGAGATIQAGGFAPELAVFDSMGLLVALDAQGGTAPGLCGGRGIDPITHFCFDAAIPGLGQPALTLAAGNYTVVLAEQGNNPLGMFADGFSQDAAHLNDPTFTGTNAGLPGAKFLDPGNFSQRTGAWAVDFSGTGIAQVNAVPEPGTFGLLGCGCLWLGWRRAKQGKQEEKS